MPDIAEIRTDLERMRERMRSALPSVWWTQLRTMMLALERRVELSAALREADGIQRSEIIWTHRETRDLDPDEIGRRALGTLRWFIQNDLGGNVSVENRQMESQLLWQAQHQRADAKVLQLALQLFVDPALDWLARSAEALSASAAPGPVAASTSLELLEVIGSGGFADVWRARDHELQRDVAVKIFRPGSPEIVAALDEARVLARVAHPNVVTVHGVVTLVHPTEGEEVTAVVLELVQGRTLEEVLRSGECSPEAALVMARGMSSAVAAMHAEGVSHADFHEKNVLVGPDGGVKIIDLLYRGTLARLPPNSQQRHYDVDVKCLRELIVRLFQTAGARPVWSREVRAATSATEVFERVLRLSERSVGGGYEMTDWNNPSAVLERRARRAGMWPASDDMSSAERSNLLYAAPRDPDGQYLCTREGVPDEWRAAPLPLGQGAQLAFGDGQASLSFGRDKNAYQVVEDHWRGLTAAAWSNVRSGWYTPSNVRGEEHRSVWMGSRGICVEMRAWMDDQGVHLRYSWVTE